jgi:N6-adenosine-specific RNA methylase IME4
MPQPCTVCHHPDRPAIDAALAANVTVRGHQNALANRYDLTPMALSRHRRAGHVPGLPGAIAVAGPLPTTPGGWQVLLADPPWRFVSWGTSAIGRQVPYARMDTDAICALPVARTAAPDAVLFLWAVGPRLPDALRVLAAWGFAYKTLAFTWVKTNADGSPFQGMGFYTRSNAELCLLATRGKGLARVAADVPQVVLSRRREHSRKPDGQYDRIGRLFGPSARRLELFARTAWPGWVAWGHEVARFAPPAALLEEAAG